MPSLGLVAVYAAGLVVSLGAIVWYFWCRVARIDDSLQDFAKLIGQVHAGKAPIEELSAAPRSVGPIAEEVKSLLHELRQQKQSIASLNQEINQRIENRTSAFAASGGIAAAAGNP